MPNGRAPFGAVGTADGKRNAFVPDPGRQITVVILTNDDSTDAEGIANTIVGRLIGTER